MTCATVSSTQHTYSTDGAPKRTLSLDTDSHLWNSDCDTRAHTFNSMWKERGDKTQQRKTKQNRKRRQFKLWCLCICTAWSHAYAYVALMSPNRTLLAKQLAYSIRSEWVGDEHFHYGQLSTTRLMTVGSGLYVLVSGVYLVQLDGERYISFATWHGRMAFYCWWNWTKCKHNRVIECAVYMCVLVCIHHWLKFKLFSPFIHMRSIRNRLRARATVTV